MVDYHHVMRNINDDIYLSKIRMNFTQSIKYYYKKSWLDYSLFCGDMAHDIMKAQCS